MFGTFDRKTSVILSVIIIEIIVVIIIIIIIMVIKGISFPFISMTVSAFYHCLV